MHLSVSHHGPKEKGREQGWVVRKELNAWRKRPGYMAQWPTCSPWTAFFWSVNVRVAYMMPPRFASFKDAAIACVVMPPIVKVMSSSRNASEHELRAPSSSREE